MTVTFIDSSMFHFPVTNEKIPKTILSPGLYDEEEESDFEMGNSEPPTTQSHIERIGSDVPQPLPLASSLHSSSSMPLTDNEPTGFSPTKGPCQDARMGPESGATVPSNNVIMQAIIPASLAPSHGSGDRDKDSSQDKVSGVEEESSRDEETTNMNVDGDSLPKTPSKTAHGTDDGGSSSDLSSLPEDKNSRGKKGTDEETDGGADSTDEESDGQHEDGTNMNINKDRDSSIQTTWDSNARKGKRWTPPTTDDEGTPESPSEDSDRDVADTGKDGGPRKSGRIRKTPPPAPKPKPRPRKKARRKAQATLKQESQSTEDKPGRHHRGNIKMLNYFEEIEFNGGSRLVDIYEIQDELVCLL